MQQNSLRGLTGGIVLIALAIAFLISRDGSGLFLPVLFIGLAVAALIGSLSTLNHKGVYGGFQGFVWLLGLAACFVIGFWPWILVVASVSALLGALAAPILGSLSGISFLNTTNQVNNQPQPYQQGYQQPTYQEGGRQYRYPQEMPPQ